jgi:hypothetical protein
MLDDAHEFVAGAFALIGLFLVLQRYTGFAQAITSVATGSATVFKTLQGR